ncbi:hypothetical protein HY484_03595 [Candidatus Woesearchaeota archaeon]|nr:hypothetical protein [Candidatus Woesearchaeota archaeon]
MSIATIVEPRVTKTWEQFCQSASQFSIALDGYVAGPPKYDAKGPFLNLNHHEGVDRLSTRSTSGQVWIYIKQGLFERFRRNGHPTANLFLNDPDQDGSLARWLLVNHERIEGEKSEPLINRLIFAEDALDTTVGAYPFPINSSLMREIAWIMAPYTDTLQNLSRMGAQEMLNVIDAVGQRISDYSIGRGQQLEPDARLEVLHQGDGWAMIKEIGPYARTKLFNKGLYSFIAYRGKKEDGVHHIYAYGKRSQFDEGLPPYPELFEELNQRENIANDNPDRWGGSTNTSGSPRISGSKFNPGQLAAVNEEIKATWLAKIK